MSQLYQIGADDPRVLLAVSGGLSLIALLAQWVPVLGAARADPLPFLK